MAEKTKIYFLKSKATGTLYVCYYDIENINNIHDKNIIVYNNDDKSNDLFLYPSTIKADVTTIIPINNVRTALSMIL